MRKLAVFVAVVTTLLLVTTVGPATATQPTDVFIGVETSLVGGPAPFVASGPAVDDGLICGSGFVVDASGKVTGNSPTGFNFQGVKHFICEDGSGGFFVNLEARIDFRRGVTFNWNVLKGTGDYEKLHGAGSGVGIGGEPCGNPNLCVLDIYDGGVHID